MVSVWHLDDLMVRMALGSLIKPLLVALLLWGWVPAWSAIIAVPYSEGFIGERQPSSGRANSIKTYATLGIERAEFFQNSSDGLFVTGVQGNDIPGGLRLFLADGSMVSVPGIINWKDSQGSILDAYGFIPSDGFSVTINNGAANAYTIKGYVSNNDRGSSLGLQVLTSNVTYTDGTNVVGNASMTGLIEALNTYLSETEGGAPQGPVSVTVLVTTNTTPTVQGSVTLAADEHLEVEINGVRYSGNAVTVDGNGNWQLTITSALNVGVYSVTATIVDSDGFTLTDPTQGELTIYTANSNFSVTYDINGGSGTAPTDTTAYAGGASVTLPSDSGMTAPAGKQFSGWNTATDGSAAAYSAGSSFTIGANTTFYAQWSTPTYSVGGSITNLAPGQTVKLTNTDGQAVSATGNAFGLSKKLQNAANYGITVSQQPPNQKCLVSNGTGSVSGSNVNSVAVKCYNRRKQDNNAGGSGKTVVAAITESSQSCAGFDIGDQYAQFIVPQNTPANEVFPYGAFEFKVTECAVGQTVTIDLVFPEALPADVIYRKQINGAWVDWTNKVTISGNTITLTITDGGEGDTDGVANGAIYDPSGPALISRDTNVATANNVVAQNNVVGGGVASGGISAIPTIPVLFLSALFGLMSLVGLHRLKKQRAC